MTVEAIERRRVLIVEDEVLIALVLEDVLDLIGYEVAGSAATYAEAEALIEAGGFDLAILDVNLGSDPIFPLADRLAARGTPFLFATGSVPGSLPDRFAGVGVIEKPYVAATVQQAIAAMPRPNALQLAK